MNKKIILIFIILISLFSLLFISINNYIGENGNKIFIYKKVSNYLPLNFKTFLKSKIFVYKQNEILNEKIKFLQHENANLKNLASHQNFEFKFNSDLKIKDNFFVKIFINPYLKILSPKTYISFYDDNLFIITGEGTIQHSNIKNFIDINNKSIFFNNINSNLKFLFLENSALDFGKLDLWEKQVVKDILIHDDKIFISYVKKVKANDKRPILALPDGYDSSPEEEKIRDELLKQNNNCYVNAIAVGDLNLKNIKFSDFLVFNECFADLAYSQTGGNLSFFKDNKILMSVGDWRSLERIGFTKNYPQDMNSYLGKILSIDLNNKNIKIISLGHRNPQGMYYDQKKDILYMTEHGPQGGDEVNINISPGKELRNYGWAISSYGEYDDIYSDNFSDEEINEKKKIGPLYKNHKDYGFVEPVIYFSPLSIGISEIVEANNFFKNTFNDQNLFFGSLGYDDVGRDSWSIHYLKLEKNQKILDRQVYKINERIRDLKKFNIEGEDIIFMTLENGSIGIAKSKKF